MSVSKDRVCQKTCDYEAIRNQKVILHNQLDEKCLWHNREQTKKSVLTELAHIYELHSKKGEKILS